MAEMQSHLDFFSLKEQPFAPTADPAYFYATREHKECLFRIWNSIDERHGIVVILGNYGTGKTTLLRKLITGMASNPDRYSTAIIGSPIPSWTSFALLESIVAQFGLHPGEPSFVTYMETLNQYLLSNRERICTLIIDDAQNLNKRGQLELLRLVQNLETPQYKLLNLVFFAQLEWMPVLRAAPNFAQRINMTYTLGPIEHDEIRNLIEFRIRQAGGQPGMAPEFDEIAVRAIHAYSEGSPRLIVSLCRNALLVASQLRTRQIGHEIILHTIDRTTLPEPEKRAQAVAAIADALRGATGAVPQEEPSGRGERAARDRQTREQRASQLLLKSVKDRQSSGMETP